MQDFFWNDLRFVLAVHRSGTLAGAAQTLKVNETTVARRLEAMSRDLDVALFEKSRGRLMPTPAGKDVISCAEDIENQLGLLSERVTGTDSSVSGNVRVSAVPLIVNRLLLPASRDVLEANPQLTIELNAEPRSLNLTHRETDIAVRLARPTQEQRAIAHRIGQLDYAVYGIFGNEQVTARWITYEDQMSDLPQHRWISKQIARSSDAELAPLRVNDADGLVHAIMAGMGKSLLPVSIAKNIEGLQMLDRPDDAPSREVWVMVHPAMKSLARIRTVIKWLETCFSRG